MTYDKNDIIRNICIVALLLGMLIGIIGIVLNNLIISMGGAFIAAMVAVIMMIL